MENFCIFSIMPNNNWGFRHFFSWDGLLAPALEGRGKGSRIKTRYAGISRAGTQPNRLFLLLLAKLPPEPTCHALPLPFSDADHT